MKNLFNIVNPITEIHKELNLIFESSPLGIILKLLQELRNSLLVLTQNPLIEIYKEINSMYKLMAESINSILELSQLLHTKFENETLLQLKIDEIKSKHKDDLTLQELIEELLTNEIKGKKERNIINESFETLCEMSPDINILKSSIESEKYRKFIIAIIIILISNSFPLYNIYDGLLNNDIHYKSNRNNVRVRSTPTKENNSNIITKLHKNTYVEKIGYSDGWVNIKFELEDGIEKEGWIYRTMLTKIED